MAANTVSRTIVWALAQAWQADGTNEDGSPRFVKVGNVEFKSTKPNKTEAYRALRNAGFNVNKDFVTFEVTASKVIAQSVDTFIEHGVVVNRTENGKIKPIEDGSENA